MRKTLTAIVASMLSLLALSHLVSAVPIVSPPTVTWDGATNRGEGFESDRVSGTDVIARPIFHSGSNPLASAKLTINGNAVRSWTFNPTITGDHTSAPIMWASTTFAHGTQITVKAECTDTVGKTGSDSFSVTTYNRAYVLGNTGSNLQFGDDAVNAVSPRMSGSNHDVTSSTTDEKSVILGNIADYTVFYAWTHGSPSDFLDTRENIAQNYITASDLSTAVGSKTDQPAYNFVFIDACQTGQTTSLNSAFGTPTYVGWSQNAPDNQKYVDWTERVFQGLQGFKTVSQAVWDVGPTEPKEIGAARGVVPQQDDTPFLFPIIAGERGTTLRGVYGNTFGEWFREMPTQ